MQWHGIRRPSVRPSVCLSVNYCANRFFSQANGRIATKLAHDGLRVSVHPRCAQGQPSRSRSKVMWYAHFLGFLEWATPSLTVWFIAFCCCRMSCEIQFRRFADDSVLLRLSIQRVGVCILSVYIVRMYTYFHFTDWLLIYLLEVYQKLLVYL